ncbi:MAG: DUF4058 family protein [Planctomycetes bacterium]|nr:DUF4058 family protein [Planctomycetota bacterium]
MRSPFPGMDPYIEAAGLWEDFHTKLIGDIERTLSALLPERYVVRAHERRYVELVYAAEAADPRRYQPDVAVLATPAWQPADEELQAETVAAVAEEDPRAFRMHGLVELERRETFLEVHEVDPHRRLITGIEVLSPANKRYGSSGWVLHERKRQAFLMGYANLVEIDLLRRGRRMPMAEKWPESPYYLLVLRKERAPECLVRTAFFNKPLPPLAIPLKPMDDDVRIELQPLVDEIYSRSRYYQDIDYHEPLQPPLSPADVAWLEQRLREAN